MVLIITSELHLEFSSASDTHIIFGIEDFSDRLDILGIIWQIYHGIWMILGPGTITAIN